MTTSHQLLCLPADDQASDFADLLAALPENSESGLPGCWRIVIQTEDGHRKEIDGVFMSDDTRGGQYCETGMAGDLERLGFGNWRITSDERIELTSTKPAFEGNECMGWEQTVYTAILGKGRFGGSGCQIVHNMQGDTLNTSTITVSATRPGTFPAAAQGEKYL